MKIVYKTTNLLNGKIYIGVDSKNQATYFGSGLHICRAIKKYGKKNFIKETIDTAKTYSAIYKKEKYWIKFYDATNPNKGYNISFGGEGSPGWLQNHPNKEAIKRKIGKTKIGNKNCVGRIMSQLTKDRIGAKSKGRISARKGIIMTAQQKKLISCTKCYHNERIAYIADLLIVFLKL